MKKQYLFSLLLCLMVGFSASAQQFIADIKAGADGSDPRDFIEYNGNIYFTAGDGVNGAELWKYNPVDNTTALVEDLRVGAGGSNPIFKTIFDGKLYFAADKLDGGAFQGEANPRELYVYDDATQQITELTLPCSIGCTTQMNPRYLTVANGALYFDAVYFLSGNQSNSKLIKYDGANFSEPSIGASGVLSYNVRVRRPMLAYNNDLYFSAPVSSNLSNNTLVKYNTNTDTASLIVNYGLVEADFLTEYAGKIYFMATVSGQNRLREYDPQSGTLVQAGNLVATTKPVGHGGILYFSTLSNTLGIYNISTLTDATLATNGTNSFIGYLVKFNSDIYFSARSSTLGQELHKYDTTSSTISLVADINNGANDAEPRNLRAFNGNIYFSADDGTNGHELWKYDGTSTPCTTPTNVAVSNISFFDADISWTGSADAADGYQWYVMTQGEVPNQGGATPVVSGSTASGTTTASVTGLNFSTNYDVYVEALCSITSTSSLSSVASFTTLSCQSPTNLATSNITDSSVTATWTASATAFDGYNWYLMNPGEVPGANTPVQNGVITNTTVNLTGLTAATSYDLYIQSKCVTGSLGGALNTFVSFTTTNVVCSAPTNVSTSNINVSTLDLSWTASADAANGYRWYIVPSGQGIGSAIETNVATGTTVNVNTSNLEAGNNYDAYLVSRCSLAPQINSSLSLVHTFSLPNPNVFIVATPTSVNENVGTYDLVITTNATSSQNITVQLVKSGTVDNGDYSISSLTAVIPAGGTGTTITVSIIDDTIIESDETLIFDIDSVINGVEIGVEQLNTTIVDNDTNNSSFLSFTNSGQNLATFASDVILGDFDNNPGLDALLSKFNDSDRMFSNNGSGTLSNTLQSIGTGGQTNSMIVGDFDLLTQKDDVYLAKQSVSGEVWTNDGSGTYVSAISNLGQSIITAESYDIDGDSADDLILVSNSDIRVYLNDVLNTFPNPSFPNVEQIISETDINDIKIGFVNNDAFPDLVLARNGENKVYFGDASGDFTNPIGFGDSENTRGLDLVDINNDGLDDVVFANLTTNFGEENTIYLSNGNSFLSVNTPQTQDDSYDVAFADFDNDGDNDIVFANDGANVIWEATPTGFQEVLNLGNSASLAVDVGDIDGDGDIDIIFANNSNVGSQIWFNNLSTLTNEDFEVAENIKLYPNPVKDTFSIVTQNNEISKVEVFNLQGQLVLSFEPSDNYNIQSLESGLYFVNVNANKASSTIKIIKE